MLLMLRNRNFLFGMILISIPLSMALLPQYIAPYNPWERVDKSFLRPNSNHLLGTNDIGQDLFSELVYGARISMLVGFAAASFTVILGVFMGTFAGYFGGILDELLTGVTDVILLLPSLPLMIVMASMLGQGFQNIILVLSILTWPGVARMIRSQVLSIRERAYVEVAKAIGCSDIRILFVHVLPQIVPLSLANIVIRIGAAMVAEASLSFLGLGDPTQKSWGVILFWVQKTGGFSLGAWWCILPPGIMITISVLGFTQLGFAIERIVNPKLKERE